MELDNNNTTVNNKLKGPKMYNNKTMVYFYSFN